MLKYKKNIFFNFNEQNAPILIKLLIVVESFSGNISFRSKNTRVSPYNWNVLHDQSDVTER